MTHVDEIHLNKADSLGGGIEEHIIQYSGGLGSLGVAQDRYLEL